MWTTWTHQCHLTMSCQPLTFAPYPSLKPAHLKLSTFTRYMHLMPLALNHIKLSLTVPPPLTNITLRLPISTELTHNKQETQLNTPPLHQFHSHQPDLPVKPVTPSEIHTYKILLSPLNTINRRNTENSTSKRAKGSKQVPITKHIRTLPDRSLRQNAHFAELPSATLQIVEQATV